MKHEAIPTDDKLALKLHIESLKNVAKTDVCYEIYESPSLYLIYLNNDVFDSLEDRIVDILGKHRNIETSKSILFVPKRFMASYEEKIENFYDDVCALNNAPQIPTSRH